MTLIGHLAISAAIVFLGLCIRSAARDLRADRDIQRAFDPYNSRDTR